MSTWLALMIHVAGIELDVSYQHHLSSTGLLEALTSAMDRFGSQLKETGGRVR